MKKRLALLFVCIFSIASIANAQVSTVKGVVTSADDNLPVIGASVMVKGTSVGAVTDVDGKYTITGVPSSATTLVVSFMGMETQELPIASVVNVVLGVDSEALEEAVITVAYGAAKKSSITGAISSVNSEKLALRPTTSVASALEGTVSGIQVAGSYGAPGEDPSIRIRGIGTVNGSSSPLYVIDGVPFGGNLSDLNPADIESMTVLKDAASSALYGNRASNGVILITTKSASKGALSVNVDAKHGVYTRAIKEYDRATADEFMEIEWMNLKNYQMTEMKMNEAEASAYASANLIPDMLHLNIYNKPDANLFDANGKLVSDAKIIGDYAEDLDWFKQTINSGSRSEYNVNGSFGTNKADAYFSMGYLNETGYVAHSDFDRLTARASVNIKPADWIKIGTNLSASHQNKNSVSGIGDGSSSYVNPFMYCRQIAPIYPVHLHDVNTGKYILDSYGYKQYDPGYYVDENGVEISTREQYKDRHVIWENDLNKDQTVRNTIEGIAYADFYFLKDFTFTLKGDINLRNNDNQTYNSAVIGDGKGNSGRAKLESYRYMNYTFQQQLNWAHQFCDHGFSALLAHENYYYNYNYTYGYKTSEVFANKGNLSNFTSITSLDGYQNNYRTESYLGRVRYNYNDKYNVEASFRRDGSSRFAKEARWGNFWSVGANWNVSREAFMQDIDWANSLKLRADFGEVGNDAGAGYYGYMALYTAEQNNNKGAYYLAQNANNELKWETGQAWGIGVETRLFDRWNLVVDYFDKRNKDLIFDVYLPLSAGATSSGSAESTVTKNLGVISNRGFEIETDFDIIRNRNFFLNFGANVTFLKNEIVSLPEQNKDGIISGSHKLVEGGDRYQYYLYSWAGVDQMTGNSLYNFDIENRYITDDNTADGNVLFGSKTDKDGNENTLMASGYTIIGDKAYVSQTTYALRKFCGSAIPKANGSFNFSLGWKSLSLNALFTYSLGGLTLDSVYQNLMSAGSSVSALHSDLLNSWNGVPAGMTEDSADRIDPNGLPQVNGGKSSDNNATSDRWLVSSNYLVFKNLSLSYKLPTAWANAIQMKGITVSASVENLFTLTARQGMDPQQSFGGGQSNYLVPARVATGSISFKF